MVSDLFRSGGSLTERAHLPFRAQVIYLDFNATAPLRPEVFVAMKPFLTERWGNPSSSYTFGSKLKAEIEAARRAVAQLVNASTSEVVFTGLRH